MKTLISHSRRSLPSIFVILFLAFAAAAQTGDLQATGAETAPPVTLNNEGLQRITNFSISGNATGNMFNAKSLFNIGGTQVLRGDECCNFFAGNGAGADPSNTGSWNSFVGSEAGFSNKWGSANSFFGYQAGYKNLGNGTSDAQLGYYNSFVGYQAGFSNETGRDNSFFGSGAGYNNKVSGNSFFGSSAGAGNEFGFDNVFVGSNAGYSNQTGGGNSFFGNRAGYNSKGSSNSFVGSNAGSFNKTGTNNTIIGANADLTSEQFTFATAIGSYAKVYSYDMVVLGKVAGTYDGIKHPADTVVVRGPLRLETLRAGSGAPLCRKPLVNEIVNCSSSSLRYKKNVVPFSSGLNLLRQLRPIRFEWKDGGMKDVGFGAEDVAAVEPLLATYNDKGEVEGVKYDRIATVLVNAVKEQQAQIEAQQQQLKQQQDQLKLQQTVIDGLKKLLCGQNPAAEICKP